MQSQRNPAVNNRRFPCAKQYNHNAGYADFKPKQVQPNITRGGAEAARVAHNHKVAGSSPAPATKIRRPLDEGFLFWHLVHDSEPSRTAGGSNSVKFHICTEFS